MGRSSDDEQMRLKAYSKRKLCAILYLTKIQRMWKRSTMQEVILKEMGIQRPYYRNTVCSEIWYEIAKDVSSPDDITECQLGYVLVEI